jgi:hypothetical protein
MKNWVSELEPETNMCIWRNEELEVRLLITMKNARQISAHPMPTM